MNLEFLFTPGIEINNVKFFVFIGLVAINFLYSLFTFYFKKSNKLIFRCIGWILALSLIGFFMYTAYTNKEVLDCDSYERSYMGGGITKDKFYHWLEVYFKEREVPYMTFRAILYGFSYLFLWIALSAYKVNKNFCLSLYALYPWSACAYLARNWYAFSIILLASCFLLFKKHWKIIGIAGFLALCYVAYHMHGSCILYAVLILAIFGYKNKNYVLTLAAIASMALFISTLYDTQSVQLLVDMLPEDIHEHLIHYSTNVPTQDEYVMLIVLCFSYLVSAVILLLSHSDTMYHGPYESIKRDLAMEAVLKKEYQEFRRMDILIYMAIAVMLLLPIYSLDVDFFRIIRFGAIFIIMAMSHAVSRSKVKVLSPIVLSSFLAFMFGTVWLLSYLDGWEIGGYDYSFWLTFI